MSNLGRITAGYIGEDVDGLNYGSNWMPRSEDSARPHIKPHQSGPAQRFGLATPNAGRGLDVMLCANGASIIFLRARPFRSLVCVHPGQSSMPSVADQFSPQRPGGNISIYCRLPTWTVGLRVYTLHKSCPQSR